jgi:nucleotide-binding universal stress UspA family protein
VWRGTVPALARGWEALFVPQSIRKILVAVDFSEPSEAALEAAIDFAGRFGAALRVFHAFELPIPLVSPYEVAIPDKYLEETRRAAEARLAEAVKRVRKAGLSADSELGEGPAAAAIVRAAESWGADLLVLGTHGHTGLKHLLLGSVAERALRSAPCSTLAVKARRG